MPDKNKHNYIYKRIKRYNRYYTVVFDNGKFVRFVKWESKKNFNKTVFKSYKKTLKKQKQKEKLEKKRVKATKQIKKIKEQERKLGYISDEDILDIEPLQPDYFLDEIKIGDKNYFVKYPDKEKLVEILETLLNRYENESLDVLYDYISLNTFLRERTKTHKKKKYKRAFEEIK